MPEVDPRFLAAKRRAGRRKLKGSLRRYMPFAAAGGAVCVLGLGLWLSWDKWNFGPRNRLAEQDPGQDPNEAAALTAQFVQAFVDFAGDPLIIRLSDEARAGQTTRRVDRPNTLDPARVISDLVYVSDAMVSAEEHFNTTLPSTQEDFAFFQSQRGTSQGSAQPTLEGLGLSSVPAAGPAQPAGDRDESEAGWGETLDKTSEALPGFTETAVENTTSVALVRTEANRLPLFTDTFVKIAAPRTLADALESTGFSAQAAKTATDAAVAIFGRSDLLTGEVLAMRGIDASEGRRLVQLSLYSGETYVGALGWSSNGTLTEATDPWVQEDLFSFSDVKPEAEAVPLQQYRMLDAFYSAGIRNRIPASVVGEAITLLSKSHDLSTFANPGDRMSILYAEHPSPSEGSASQILRITLQGQDVDIDCFVFASTGGDYGCFGRTGGASGGGMGLANGMATPVRGVMTSTFGPRKHPILETVRLHKGVDWAAPIGTPITAAFSGSVSFAGDGGEYGNLVKISHANGFETRYAHMDAIAPGIAAGVQVKAGQEIGALGSTGLSTGPHLHFELRLNGEAVDPLVGGAQSAGGSVEALVDQIVRVESGGNAEAKNPLSTATGLGQFIESTWIRMMQTYRPDLATSLGREELLALRTDPTIARQMVTNLARESEAYLRARGHGSTPGRLYLAHFLGAEGAAQVLSAPPDADLAELLGKGVVSANPFLTEKDAAYVITWADQKMSGKGGRVGAVAPEPAGLAEFRAAILASTSGF